MKTYEEAEV